MGARDALADTPAEAAPMRLHAQLMTALRDRIGRDGLRQVRAAALLGVTQPRISDPMRGRIDPFTDALVTLLAAA